MSSKIPFIKMHGLGNNYIYINGFHHSLEESSLRDLAIAVSNVNTGIGSDGLIVMGPSDVADLKMRIFNRDGSEGKNCGNGLRCVAKYAYEQKLVAQKSMKIETLSGIVEATVASESMVEVNMGRPRLERRPIPMVGDAAEKVVAERFDVGEHRLTVTAVSMGNPHAVFFGEDLKSNPHISLGPIIEKDPRFPEGVNVEFVEVESPRSLRCKVWERGSGVTQACGTGACAVAVAAVLNGFSVRGEEIAVHLYGGTLQITWREDGAVMMVGPATLVAEGILYF